MKRFIDIHIPISHCNLKCEYCYVSHQNYRGTEKTVFKYSPEVIRKGLSSERLGGICHFNMCGMGETLIPKEIVAYTEAILSEGHYVMIVTNGTLTNRFIEFSKLPEEQKKRLGFKFSFHYEELRKNDMLDIFVSNFQFVRENGMSCSVEMTPYDELEDKIDEICQFCIENFGALCHLTIPRDMKYEDIRLLSKHDVEEFVNRWSKFDSKMMEFKKSTWGIKRKEYCYAGVWSGLLNIGDGILKACYESKVSQNIFDDVNKPINFIAVGRCCKLPHCYNSHSLLALGCIPEIRTIHYNEERNRLDSRTNTNWLTDEMDEFLNHRLEDYNDRWSTKDKVLNKIKTYKLYMKKALNIIKK